jgi:mannose-1-phosphate guanylyltransferase/mannose-6-phosphate isomerase
MIIPVILCGGAGLRLWPVSRETHPKPFMRLADGQSLLQKAFFRGLVLPNVLEILTVTNQELLFKTQEAYRQVNPQGLPTPSVLEPFGRNTPAALQVQGAHVDEAMQRP